MSLQRCNLFSINGKGVCLLNKRKRKGKLMFFGWEINGIAAFIIIIAFMLFKNHKEKREKLNDIKQYNQELDRKKDIRQTISTNSTDDKSESIDPIDQEDYEWWNDPRWK